MNSFHYAPKPKIVDGFNACPLHIDQVTASMVFDGSSEISQCIAEMEFTIGPYSGYPFFDLRQTISSATLDGTPLSVAELAHHDFGGGANTQLRIIEQWLVSGSSHVLSLTYDLDTPDAPNARGVIWESGPRLSFDFHLSDLNPSRYLESWLPSNLQFDSFPVALDVQITNTDLPHTILTNGVLSLLDTNHWQVDFPAHFASCSPMLLIEAQDRVVRHTATASLTGGTVVTLDLMKRASDVALDLNSAAATVENDLDDFHSSIGPYMHGNRYTALLTSGPQHSMEYDGGTTSSMSALRHEIFHSWWARGMLPARGEDGWLDEAWTTYNMAPDAVPLDMADTPVAMWTNNPFVRKTHGSAYGHGASVFSGIAADIGIATLKSYMADIYNGRKGRRFTTPEIEAELIRRSGALQIANYFNRFVYGFDSLPDSLDPDLFLQDASDDTGDVPYTGAFWLSPDVWVRNADDDGTTPQNPESGQDNWLYARVHNRGNATSRSFVVGWKIQVWAGTEFVFPGDWFPLTAVTIGFDLGPGETQIIKARWPKTDIPPVGSHGCLLAMVFDPDDPTATGAHIWEHNNLAQRNVTVVDLVADQWAELDFWLGSRFLWETRLLELEIIRPREWPELDIRIAHKSPEVIKCLYRGQERLRELDSVSKRTSVKFDAPKVIRFFGGASDLKPSVGSKLSYLSDQESVRIPARLQADLLKDRNRGPEIRFHDGLRVVMPVTLRGGHREGLKLRFHAPSSAKPGESFRFDLVQRASRDRICGGFSVQVNIVREKGGKS